VIRDGMPVCRMTRYICAKSSRFQRLSPAPVCT